jgi:hypothetical protein
MTSEAQKRLEKFKRKAPMVQTQAHLDKIMGSFPEEDRPTVLAAVQPMLKLQK